MSFKRAEASPPHSGPRKSPPNLEPEDTPPAPAPVPMASSLRFALPALLPPPCESVALGSPQVRPGTAGSGGAAEPESGRSIHSGPTPRRHPSQRRRSRRGRIRARLTWGPQPPQLTGMSAARNDQPRELPSRRAPPPAAAPSPPPSRPAARPRPAHPQLPPPPPQLQPATPPSPHASHSLSREGGTLLARRTPRPSPRKSGWALKEGKKQQEKPSHVLRGS